VADISRRAILRGVSLAGAASVGAATGYGTHALLTDGELFEASRLSSGSLDLQVAAKTGADGDFPSSFAAENAITVEFPEVEPNGGPASGTATVALRVCDNPGRVWLRPRSDKGDSKLAERLDVTLSYAVHCGGSDGTIYEGSLAGLLDAFGDGTQLGASCRELGKVEFEGDKFVVETDEGYGGSLLVDKVPGDLTFDRPDGSVTVRIADLHWKDEGSEDAEIIGVDLASDDVGFCRVDAKGGTDVVTYRPGCASTVDDLFADKNRGDQPSGLSHFVVYDCPDGDPCIGCDPACLELEWELKKPKKVAGESLSLDLELYASQCRHSTSENPWN
jgi:hypothetical protein